jgi:hypothetical protein
VRTNTKKETHVNTEGSDVGSGLTADPEDAQMTVIIEFDDTAFVDCTDT